ncbi:MAG TPA: hypothetical protein VI198_07795, partial [Candidatus Eisenbacteria bacterium]
MTVGFAWLRMLPLLALLVAAGQARAFERETPFVVRPYPPTSGAHPLGAGIAYGPHRDGQRPGGPSPTKEEVRQDLRLLAARWALVRLYGSVGPADSILAVIREDGLPLKLMLGVWIAPEDARDSTGAVVSQFPEAVSANRAEVEAAVRLAAAYPDLVAALCVGNETQVSWSSHRVPAPLLTDYIRELRARTTRPVTTGDDYLFWKSSASADLAAEIDFIVTHLHPLWAGQTPERAAAWARNGYAELRSAHPKRSIVIGETGWATMKLTTGEQGTLMKGDVGEEAQAAYCTQIATWAN